MAKNPATCQWVSLEEALSAFAACQSGTQSAGHIKPLHWYVACRLVIEGGFSPDDITPRPPFALVSKGAGCMVKHDADLGGGGERTLLGGLKTKAVDVVVTKNGLGPVLAVSLKGTLNAFRNLTNRMEEAVGDCTNLHIAYPALVYGFWQVLRANPEGSDIPPGDVAVLRDGSPVESIRRYHDVLMRLADRRDVRADSTKYEAIALTLVSATPPSVGQVIATFPSAGSPLLLDDFFAKLYEQYDQRFVYAAPALKTTTERREWTSDSPVLRDSRTAGYTPRIADAC